MLMESLPMVTATSVAPSLVYTTLSSAKERSNLPKSPTWVRKTWS